MAREASWEKVKKAMAPWKMKIDFYFVEMLQMSKMWLAMKRTIYHSNLAKVTPQSTSILPPCLLLGIQLMFKTQLQSTFTTTKQKSSKTSRCKVDATLHDAQEELMHHIEKHSFPPGLFDDVHQWAEKWLKLGYKFESAKSKQL
jgi:hypothetical protein